MLQSPQFAILPAFQLSYVLHTSNPPVSMHVAFNLILGHFQNQFDSIFRAINRSDGHPAADAAETNFAMSKTVLPYSIVPQA